MGLFQKKKESTSVTLADFKKANGEVRDLLKEIKNEAKGCKNTSVLEALKNIHLEYDYKAIRMNDVKEEDLKNLVYLTQLIKEALLDTQELLRKGTAYGVVLALHRVKEMETDRSIGKSQFLIPSFQKFESNYWGIVKLREFAYGEIERLRTKQDTITKTALNEKDPSMRVRYFDDIHAIDKDILRLEKDARNYDAYQATLHSEEVLKEVLRDTYASPSEVVDIEKLEKAIALYQKD